MAISEFLGIQPRVREILEALDISVDAIGNDLQSIMDYVDTLETGIDVLKGYTDTLEAETLLLKGYTDTLESGQTTINGKLDNIISSLEIVTDHIHNGEMVYPTLADGITITSGTGKWTLGNFVELIPANTINAPFDMHFFNTALASLVGTYEIHLYAGAVNSEVLFSKVRFARLSNQTGATPFPILTPVFPANTRISAKMAVNVVTQETLVCSIAYHTY